MTDSLADDRAYHRFEDYALEIESICFEDDRYLAIDAGDKLKHKSLLYSLQVLGRDHSGDHHILNDKFYINGRNCLSVHLITDAWCQKHPVR